MAFSLPTSPPISEPGDPGVEGSFALPFTCEQRIPGNPLDLSCSDGIALLPSGSRLQADLFFWLPGLLNGPSHNQHVLHMAAHAGYRVLSVPWDTQFPTSGWCLTLDANGNPEYAGGVCDEAYDCADLVHREFLTGVDSPQTQLYPARYWSSIERRATRSLQALYWSDLDDVASPTNDHEWEQYCEPDDTYGSRLRWEDVVIGGMSMGAGQAMHTYYTEPSLDALFTAEGFGDFCEVAMVWNGSEWELDNTTGELSPYYYDDWAAGILATPPVGRIFSAFHLSNDAWPQRDDLYYDAPQTYEAMGHQFGAAPNFVHDYDSTALPLNGVEVLVTDQEPAGASAGVPYHGSMAGDNTMPDDVVGGSKPDEPGTAGLSGTASVYLFDAYVEGMCSLGDFY